MGTPMAPTVANLFMGFLESKLLENSPIRIDPALWKRFIDDIFLLWTGTKSDLEQFSQFLNAFHPTIKFTVSSSPTSIPFLDILIKLENGYLSTDLFTKDTDAHAYLHYKSCHPRHCVNNIPTSQFLRLRRVCSNPSDFNTQSELMTAHFLHRGYPSYLIEKAKMKAMQTSRHTTMQYKHKTKQTRVPFVITHNPINPPLRQWLKQKLHVLHDSTRMLKAVPVEPVVGERNSKSLRNILMPSSLPPVSVPSNEAGCFKCNKKCIICTQHLKETKTFSSSRTSESFTIREKFNCDSQNIIYMLYCDKCEHNQYVGETKNSLKVRFYQHRSNINKNTGTLVTQHFNSPNHSLANMKCIVLERVHGIDHNSRLKRERFWMEKLQTLFPLGLNSLDG